MARCRRYGLTDRYTATDCGAGLPCHTSTLAGPHRCANLPHTDTAPRSPGAIRTPLVLGSEPRSQVFGHRHQCRAIPILAPSALHNRRTTSPRMQRGAGTFNAPWRQHGALHRRGGRAEASGARAASSGARGAGWSRCPPAPEPGRAAGRVSASSPVRGAAPQPWGTAGWRISSRWSTGCRTPSPPSGRMPTSTCRRSLWWGGRAPARAPCWRISSGGERGVSPGARAELPHGHRGVRGQRGAGAARAEAPHGQSGAGTGAGTARAEPPHGQRGAGTARRGDSAPLAAPRLGACVVRGQRCRTAGRCGAGVRAGAGGRA